MPRPAGNYFDLSGHVRLSRAVTLRLLLLTFAAFGLAGCAALDEFLADMDSGPEVVYVREPAGPVYFDPYYNQPKIYVQSRPEVYYESTSKKSKGGRVYKTTTVRNEYGDTVYKHTSSKKKKK